MTTTQAKPRTYVVPELIAKKRDGAELSPAEIAWLIERFASSEIPDYQMSALAMAIYFRGMSSSETRSLTLAMRDSGQVVDLRRVPGIKVDKHSTGGVGDKVSICLAPLVAACGVPVPMMSGRGLGHTGGTLDKLEAIPGFKTQLSQRRFIRQLQTVGCALIGQTKTLAPADRRLYALRDVTGTVESIPLITASILSKKLAAGIDALVLDVKVGDGAFMKNEEQAMKLARTIVSVAKDAGKRVSAFLTSMDVPLGKTVGNALELTEAFEVLSGGGPDDLRECTFVLAAEMLRLGRVVKTQAAAHRMLEDTIRSGAAIRKMERIVRAQGGDARVVTEPDRLPTAPCVQTWASPASGYVKTMDALEVGLAAVQLGAGRTRTDDVIDHRVGIVLHAKPGDPIRQGAPLVSVHARNRTTAKECLVRLRAAINVVRQRVRTPPLVLATLRA